MSAFPQLRGVYLAECDTHCVVDVGFLPCHTSERVGGLCLLRSISRGMLLMGDCGGHDFAMGCLPNQVKPLLLRTLSNDSLLAYLQPADDSWLRRGVRILVRVVTSSITDPALPSYGKEHRLITTLLNPRLPPAHEVACCYHEHWAIELVIDASDTHQFLVGQTLRLLTPPGGIQELYGLPLAHYAVRVLMHEAALWAEVDLDRLSFVHALEIVRDVVPAFHLVPSQQHRALTECLLREIAAKRWRSNLRVLKRKMANFKLKRAEHHRPPKPMGSFRAAICIYPPPVLEFPNPPPAIRTTILVEWLQ